MRMRKKKNAETRLASCERFLLNVGESSIERPAELFGMTGAPLFLEIGAGKGAFACEMARRNPDAAYIAMERVTDCVVIAAERAASSEYGELTNLRFLIDTADNLMRLFGKNSVDRIFLNFSDPWSKKGYAKRRLTHRRYLAVYMNLLKDGGVLRFKTDNDALFDFSLEETEAMGLKCRIVTRDLHASEWMADNVMTEYETNFASQGKNINMLELVKPDGFMPEVDAAFLGESRYSVRSEND